MATAITDPPFQKAVALHEAGKYGEAAAIYRDILVKEPSNVMAMHLLALVAMQLDNAQMVLNLADAGLQIEPNFAVLYQDKATAMRRLGEKEKAMACIDKAISLDAATGEYYDTKAQIYRDLRQFDKAVEALQTGITLSPHNAALYNSLAIILHRMGAHDEALVAINTYLRLKPDSAPGHNNKGNILKAVRRYHEAIVSYERALSMEPNIFMGKANLGMCYLVLGEWKKGWPLFEDRKPGNMPPEVKRFDVAKRWRGEALKDKTLILYNEQGLGDTLQFCRYLKMAQERAPHIILQVQRPLVSFMQAQWPDLTIADDHEPVATYDLQCPLMSLPGIFGTTPHKVPDAAGYLKALPDKIEEWKNRLPHHDKKKVGLVWAGNPDHMNDHIRSIPLPMMKELLATNGVQFIAIQKGEKPLAQIQELDEALQPIALGDQLQDFNDTAGLLMNLDLLVTVDTSVLHMAGALGKPAWALLQYDPDWRWMINRDDTPWYNKVRLFRQPRYGDWQDVLKRTTLALTEWAKKP